METPLEVIGDEEEETRACGVRRLKRCYVKARSYYKASYRGRMHKAELWFRTPKVLRHYLGERFGQ